MLNIPFLYFLYPFRDNLKKMFVSSPLLGDIFFNVSLPVL